MTTEDRLADLFRRYAEVVRTGTESEALDIRRLIRAEVFYERRAAPFRK